MLSGIQCSPADTVAVGEPVVFVCGGASERQQCILPGELKNLHQNCFSNELKSQLVNLSISFAHFYVGCNSEGFVTFSFY